MKKMKVLALLGLAVAASWMVCRTSERSRLTRALDKKAEAFDVLLAREEHRGSLEVMAAAQAYLYETADVMTRTGLLFGFFFSKAEKQILFDNAGKRLVRLREMLLNNPSFRRSQYLPDLAGLIDRFFEKIGLAANFKKDRDTMEIISRWTQSGERFKIYFTDKEKDMHHSESLVAYREDLAAEARAAREKAEREKPVTPDVPGIEAVLQAKQREVTRTVQETVPLAELGRYEGQELHFQLKSGRRIKGTYSGSDGSRVAIGFIVEGNSLTHHVPLEEIDRVERISVRKVLETYDPAMERESSLAADFAYLEYQPDPRDKRHVGFVTADGRMVFVHVDMGVLACHSRENAEGYRPMATYLGRDWLKKFRIARDILEHGSQDTYRIQKFYSLLELGWYRLPEHRSSFDHSGMTILNKRLDGTFDFIFQLRLVKEMAPGTPPIIIVQRDLALNERTVRLMFPSQNADRALYEFGNPRYVKGPLPWEYQLQMR